MQTGDILFVGHNGPIDNMIRFFDKGPYNHVCIAVSDTQILEAQYDTRVHVIDNPYTGPDYVTDVVHLNLNDEQVAKLETLKETYIGERYDFGEIFLIFLRLEFGINIHHFHNDNEVICSELVGHLLVGLGLSDESVLELTPNELHKYLKDKGY